MKNYMKIIIFALSFLLLNPLAKAQASAPNFDAKCDSLCMAQKRLDLQILEIQYQKAQLVKRQVQQVNATYESESALYLKAVAEIDFNLQQQINNMVRLASIQKAELTAKFKVKWESHISSEQIERCTDRCPAPIR